MDVYIVKNKALKEKYYEYWDDVGSFQQLMENNILNNITSNLKNSKSIIMNIIMLTFYSYSIEKWQSYVF